MTQERRAGTAHGRFRGRPPGRPGDAPQTEEGHAILYGFHPVAEALGNARRRVRRLLLTENAAIRLRTEHPGLEASPEIVRAAEISRLLEADAVHQGFYLEADPLPALALEDLGDNALVLALDQVTDPHNVGAITRTAAAFGVDAILTTLRHSPAATGVLAKAASGGLEHVPVVSVRNLAESLIELGSRGFRRIGLDSAGDVPLAAVPPGRPAVIVLGAEGRGLRQRTRDNCDVLARLDMPGAVKSLNVSNAAAVALYALYAARPPSEDVSEGG